MLIKKIYNKFRRKLFPTPYEKTVKAWFAQSGDTTYRLEYPELGRESIVFDVGGYKGDFAARIQEKMKVQSGQSGTIYIFEPIKAFANNIEKRFSGNDSIKVYPFGLNGGTCKEADMGLDGDASSAIQVDAVPHEHVLMKNITEFMDQESIEHIDLLKVNIEGGEFELLTHLINTKYIDKIENIQVQFHNFIPNAQQMMEEIQTKLTKTHTLTWQFYFVWENWKRKVQ